MIRTTCIILALTASSLAQNSSYEFEADPLSMTPAGFVVRSGALEAAAHPNGGQVARTPGMGLTTTTVQQSRGEWSAIEMTVRNFASDQGPRGTGIISNFDTGQGSYFALTAESRNAPFMVLDTLRLRWFDGTQATDLAVLSGVPAGPDPSRMRLRLQTTHLGGRLFRLEGGFDLDENGLIDQRIDQTFLLPAGHRLDGAVGSWGEGLGAFDHYRIYRTALSEEPTATGIGTAFSGRTAPNVAVFGAFAFSAQTGFDSGLGFQVPLDPDGLFALTTAQPLLLPGMLGSSDAQGHFALTAPIPTPLNSGAYGTAAFLCVVAARVPTPWISPAIELRFP